MGLFDRFRRGSITEYVTPEPDAFFGDWRLTDEDRNRILGLSPSEMWRTQPYLRTIVTFLARNIAQLGLQTFQRVNENDRQRLRDGALVQALKRPNRDTTAYELVYGLVADLALYDCAYWLLTADPDQPLTRLPVEWVIPKGGDALGPEVYQVRMTQSGQTITVKAENVLAFHGWDPGNLTTGSAPIRALKELLAEQVEAARYRENTWKRGGKVGAVLTRPPGVGWTSDEARKQFKADFDANYTGDGPKVGGTPLLEDGMKLERVDFSATEMQFIEGSRLALNTVASVYHVNPTMIGLLDNANYSNVREFRRMLYGDTLGPILAQIEDRLNTFLVPFLDSRDGVYVEFNIAEKLQGSFEEQAAALQTSVGAPWMTRAEARGLVNLPAIPDADGLVTPLNVLIGNQSSPTDAGSQNTSPKARTLRVKSAPTNHQAKIREVMAGFFARQGKSVLPRIGAAGDWWDAKRWNDELGADLLKVSHTVADLLGTAEAGRLGYAGGYDADRTVEFLKKVTAAQASRINDTTHGQLKDAVADVDSDPADVFTQATTTRSDGIAQGIGTFVAGFAVHEAGSQIAYDNGVKPSKTWVTGQNPRPEHAALDGETVSIDESFSNGAGWPGDDGEPGCNCDVSVSIP